MEIIEAFWGPLEPLETSKTLFSVDTVGMACRQSKIHDCRDTVDDRVSTTAVELRSTPVV